jgi:hypothetical protein
MHAELAARAATRLGYVREDRAGRDAAWSSAPLGARPERIGEEVLRRVSVDGAGP